MMLDGRSYRDRQVLASDYVALTNPQRWMLGAEQEAWLYDALRTSQRTGTAWRLLGQQVIFAPFVPQVGSALEVDNWEGYPAAPVAVLRLRRIRPDCRRRRAHGRHPQLVGARSAAQPALRVCETTGRGSLAVEIITPAVIAAFVLLARLIARTR